MPGGSPLPTELTGSGHGLGGFRSPLANELIAAEHGEVARQLPQEGGGGRALGSPRPGGATPGGGVFRGGEQTQLK